MVATTGRSQSVADGRFQSLTLIGSGGMGIVYAATDTLTRRPVALKLARRRPGSLKRSNDLLQREALALALAGGRHVCSLYDLAEHAGQTCLVMERLIGESLEARLLRGRLAPPSNCSIWPSRSRRRSSRFTRWAWSTRTSSRRTRS